MHPTRKESIETMIDVHDDTKNQTNVILQLGSEAVSEELVS